MNRERTRERAKRERERERLEEVNIYFLERKPSDEYYLLALSTIALSTLK